MLKCYKTYGNIARIYGSIVRIHGNIGKTYGNIVDILSKNGDYERLSLNNLSVVICLLLNKSIAGWLLIIN
ncbi:MAG: hypothetical protein DRP18_03055 [Candidatus Aenigmatarchaeota archaeon]|nr:MAG: hypothetical protein DRP18_03055 [Candidatus Aenigmarchaeota archaeon]